VTDDGTTFNPLHRPATNPERHNAQRNRRQTTAV